MIRSIFIRGVATVVFGVAVTVAGSAGAASHEDEGLVAPSEYVEDIETPGDTGGVMDEVDSGAAQAEAAEAAAKKADAKKAPADEDDDEDEDDDDEGGW